MKAMNIRLLAAAMLITFFAAGLVTAQTKNPNYGTTPNRGPLFIDANGDGICDNFGPGKGSGLKNGSGKKYGSGKGFGMKSGNGYGICDGTGKGPGRGNGTGVCDGTGPKGRRGGR